jgi:D-alanyl-D-alanine-carboxypeptidase/D-alanyl-D-alanine-endopeptidase
MDFVETVESLDEVLPGAEAMFAGVFERGLLDGAAVGILREGRAYVRAMGAGVAVDSVFEIGSVTKTYTAELLSRLVARGMVRLEDAVAMYKPQAGDTGEGVRPITLLDLATHQSGLPRLPSNLRRVLVGNPYARYGSADLERYLKKRGLVRAEDAKFLYSNLGFAVLGYALSWAAGASYEEALRAEVFEPVGLNGTFLAMSGRTLPAILQGHFPNGRRSVHWTFDVFAPAGAICSTVEDQMKWIDWLLSDAERIALKVYAPAGPISVGLGWMIRPGGESCWHNGATGGFSSYMGVHRGRRTGVVLLANRCSPELVTTLGSNLERLERGLPVIPLK